MGQEVWKVQSDCFFCIKKKPYKSRDDLGFLVSIIKLHRPDSSTNIKQVKKLYRLIQISLYPVS